MQAKRSFVSLAIIQEASGHTVIPEFLRKEISKGPAFIDSSPGSRHRFPPWVRDTVEGKEPLTSEAKISQGSKNAKGNYSWKEILFLSGEIERQLRTGMTAHRACVQDRHHKKMIFAAAREGTAGLCCLPRKATDEQLHQGWRKPWVTLPVKQKVQDDNCHLVQI